MPAADVGAALANRFGAEAFALGVKVPAAALAEVLRALRDVHGYRYYVLASATDRPQAFEIVHGVRNAESADTFFVKTEVPKDAATVDSVAMIYAGAEWYEREVYDLFGVTFRGHPDPRRILMPDDYDGHPLRKDFPMDTPWGYRPSTREEKA
jgi:NADH-quinone oxidoreductase subunit C